MGVVRGPFMASKQAFTDGVGLNPLLRIGDDQPPAGVVHRLLVVRGAVRDCAALLKRDQPGWAKLVLRAVFSTAVRTGSLGGVGVQGARLGRLPGWDPVENGPLIPWFFNIALVHGLLVQRATGSLRRTNFFLAILSYVLVLYASFLTRSGVLADFSVHSFAANDDWKLPLGLGGFLIGLVTLAATVGFGLLLSRLREIPKASEALGAFSRESFMWLGQLVFMLMCALVAIGMSAPLITRLFGPPSNVQTSYYNLVNAPLAIAMGLLLGIAPLLRWRQHEPGAFVRAAVPSMVFALAGGVPAFWAGIQTPCPRPSCSPCASRSRPTSW